MLRIYDEAIFEWADFKLKTKGGEWKSVPKIFATPDRAFADMAQELDTAFPLPSGAQRSQKDVTLPIVSVSRTTDPDLDFERMRAGRVKLGFTQMSIDGNMSPDIHISPSPTFRQLRNPLSSPM